MQGFQVRDNTFEQIIIVNVGLVKGVKEDLLTRYFQRPYHEVDERNLLCFYEKQAFQAKGDHF
jgi:hypothetical protein